MTHIDVYFTHIKRRSVFKKHVLQSHGYYTDSHAFHFSTSQSALLLLNKAYDQVLLRGAPPRIFRKLLLKPFAFSFKSPSIEENR